MANRRSKLVTTATTAATEGLPPEIITDILRRLPSKPLGRFKSVSKEWLTLISQSQFIKTHQKTLNQNHLFFLYYQSSIYSLPFNHHESPAALSSSKPTMFHLESSYVDDMLSFRFRGSSNGLLLLSVHEMFQSNRIVILNPTTREFLLLPSTHHPYGFCYDAVTDDYKVYSVLYSDFMSVEVYSLRTKTYKYVTIKDSPYYPNKWCLRGVIVNGFFHWIANKEKVESDKHLPVILAFSLADREVSEVPSPKGIDINNCTLAAVGEKLAIFHEAEGEVWLMNDYGIRESWTNILTRKLYRKPMILYDDGKILLVSNSGMLIYDVEKSSFCGDINFASNFDQLDLDHLKVMCVCSESLVSPVPKASSPQISAAEPYRNRQLQAKVRSYA